MTVITKNLGQVSAVFIDTVPPTNTKLLWYNNNIGIKQFYYFDTFTNIWTPLIATSGGGTSIGSVRSGKENLTANVANTIIFKFGGVATPFTDDKWTFNGEPYCLDSDGEKIFVTISDRTKDGFKANPGDLNGTIEYKVTYLGV